MRCIWHDGFRGAETLREGRVKSVVYGESVQVDNEVYQSGRV